MALWVFGPAAHRPGHLAHAGPRAYPKKGSDPFECGGSDPFFGYPRVVRGTLDGNLVADLLLVRQPGVYQLLLPVPVPDAAGPGRVVLQRRRRLMERPAPSRPARLHSPRPLPIIPLPSPRPANAVRRRRWPPSHTILFRRCPHVAAFRRRPH